jgi:protein-L-isoaspartate(D-aspartate) O-methyltransferase
MTIEIEAARSAMIEQQIRPWEVLDPRVLDALRTVPREEFVPVRHRQLAFADLAIPLEHGESMLKPTVEGRLLQALDLDASVCVLEIGTGSGFFAACLSRLARAVTSIDIHPDFTKQAAARCLGLGYGNIDWLAADAFAFEPGRQFDAVCCTGSVAVVPDRFLSWVRPGGRLVVVKGLSPVQEALRLTRTDSGWTTESLFDTDIPYLHGAEPVDRFTL